MPNSKRPKSPLALHERGLLEENRAILRKMEHHRSEDFNRLILPKCESIVRAIGHRMAYDAALDAGLDPQITQLYLAITVKQDSAWYAEHGFSRVAQDTLEDEAIRAALPCLSSWLHDTGLKRYVQTPIASQRDWDLFTNGLKAFNGSDSSQVAAKL